MLNQTTFLFSLQNNISTTCLIPTPWLDEVVWSFKLGSYPLSAFKRKLSVSPTKVFRGSCTSASHSVPYLPLLVNFQSSSQLTFVAVQPMDPKEIPEWDMISSLFYFTPNISHPTKPYRTNLTEDFNSNDKGPM